jgi:hypothetical protein
MKILYLWVEGKGWTPFQYNKLSELTKEFVSRNIELGDGCKLGDGCELGDGKIVPKSLFINASRHTVSYWGEDVIQIGCKRYSISEWQKHFQKIGEAEGYSPEQMEEYKGYIDLIATMHKTWALH